MMILLLLIAVAAAGQTLPEPILVYSQLPRYPLLAAAARIEGTVKLILTLNEKGEVASVEVISGHPMLKSAANEIV